MSMSHHALKFQTPAQQRAVSNRQSDFVGHSGHACKAVIAVAAMQSLRGLDIKLQCLRARVAGKIKAQASGFHALFRVGSREL